MLPRTSISALALCLVSTMSILGTKLKFQQSHLLSQLAAHGLLFVEEQLLSLLLMLLLRFLLEVIRLALGRCLSILGLAESTSAWRDGQGLGGQMDKGLARWMDKGLARRTRAWQDGQALRDRQGLHVDGQGLSVGAALHFFVLLLPLRTSRPTHVTLLAPCLA